jgi:plasmid maintenance system antidote protein VapI
MGQLHLTRRHLIQELLEEHAIGPEELADCVGKEPRVISAMLKLDSHLRISDDLARQIETVFSKPAYWLDGDDDDEGSELPTHH